MELYNGIGEATCKWLPDIDLEKCTGYGKCVEVCPPKSIKIVNNDFALLVHAEGCTSEANCVEACAEDAIHMEWIEMTGEHSAGMWKKIMRL